MDILLHLPAFNEFSVDVQGMASHSRVVNSVCPLFAILTVFFFVSRLNFAYLWKMSQYPLLSLKAVTAHFIN
jgi:hypothetical protein